ncbi:MAG: AbrB/MazE/SpoVT family DNA-binding domain-containing protein [Sulfobacillus sp.]|nr:AbrB/MazE/SpoVT family DNA-binding domain-containing protein [Sulfobacillus sp.]
MSLSKITRNGQVTIPKLIREAFSLEEGDYVDILRDGDQIVMRPKKVKIIDASASYLWRNQVAEAQAEPVPESHPQRFKVWLGWDADASLWVAYVPALNHVSARGETREEALKNAQEAILSYLGLSGKTVQATPVGDVSEMVEIDIP